MQVVLKDGVRKGEIYEVSKDEGTFPVILTNDHKYAFAEYLIIPQRTLLGERLAVFVGMVER